MFQNFLEIQAQPSGSAARTLVKQSTYKQHRFQSVSEMLLVPDLQHLPRALCSSLPGIASPDVLRCPRPHLSQPSRPVKMAAAIASPLAGTENAALAEKKARELKGFKGFQRSNPQCAYLLPSSQWGATEQRHSVACLLSGRINLKSLNFIILSSGAWMQQPHKNGES